MDKNTERNSATMDRRLPISKLCGVPSAARLALRSQRITTCVQLLEAAASAGDRAALAAVTGIDEAVLLALVCRADLARIKGIGTVFGLMLERIGIVDIQRLAAQEPQALHDALQRCNREERLARRSPTIEEAEAWIADARRLPIIVTHAGETRPAR